MYRELWCKDIYLFSSTQTNVLMNLCTFILQKQQKASIYFFHVPSELKQAVLSRQREYKLAAIDAKQSGDIELAKHHYLTAKVTQPLSFNGN